MGIATDLMDKIGIESNKVKWFFLGFLVYLILNIIGITHEIPVLDGLKISVTSSMHGWIFSALIVAFILLIHEDYI